LIFTKYTEDERTILRKIISANGESFLYEDSKYLACPVGAENYIRKKFPNIEDRSYTYTPCVDIDPKMKDADARNDLQVTAFNFFQKSKNDPQIGIIVPPGEGKTVMGIQMAKAYNKRTMIICPTKGIKEQWIITLQTIFDIDPKDIQDVKKPGDLRNLNKDWIICLQQSIQPYIRDRTFGEIMEKSGVGVKIIDETHTFFKNTIGIECSCNIRYNIYLTATFEKSGEEENRLFQALYAKLTFFKVDQNDLEKFNIKKHVIVQSYAIDSMVNHKQVTQMMTVAKVGKRKIYTINIGRYMQVVVPTSGSTAFMRQVLTIVKKTRDSVDYGRILILTATINSVHRFAELIKQLYPKQNVATYVSTNTPAQNTKNKKEADILVSTIKSSGLGLDMKGLSAVICVEQFNSAVYVQQAFGRLRRRDDGKDTYYIDIRDKRITIFSKWWEARRKVLARIAKKLENK
jgi:superfamily II DNA or RNA helicase